MTVTAFLDRIAFEGLSDGTEIAARTPVVSGVDDSTGRVVWSGKLQNGAIPRFAGAYDLLTCRFDIPGGARYVSEIDPSVPANKAPFEKRPLKGTSSSITPEDVEYLGMRQSLTEHNQAAIQKSAGYPNAIEHAYNGKTYYFDRALIEDADKKYRKLRDMDVSCLMRYINSAYIAGANCDPAVNKLIEHPAYDRDYPSAYVSAFNLRTEEGVECFLACTDFLLAHYAGNKENGYITGFEVGNEVTSQYVWNNAGDMTHAQFAKEYTSVLRICWQLTRKYSAAFRIYASFDQYFAGRHVSDQPLRFYGMRDLIADIQALCDREGDFGWHVAFHPYPENLSYPDFWNDRAPNWTYETARVTFKNVEVVPAYLAEERFLYRGEPRHIALPEQGFNSRDGEGEEYTLEQGAHGYCLAYLKIRALPTVDLFLHHSYMDNPWEFGLNLGIRYYGDGTLPGPRKPVCDVIHDMDTPREGKRIEEARAYIGEKLFDRVLRPPKIEKARDHSKDGFNINKDQKKENQTQNFDV